MEDAQPAKRRRLSMACNECRRRKVKCDAEHPKCRNCSVRNANCITSDPKRPGIPVIREWIEDKPTFTQEPPLVDGSANQNAEHSSQKSPTDPKETPNAESNLGSGEINEISPVYHPYEMSFHADHGTNRLKMMGGSSCACLIKSLDLYLEAANIKPVSSSFQHGMRHAEELMLPLLVSLPTLPTLDVRQNYINAYFNRIHVLWPIFDIDETKNAIHSFASVPNLTSISRDQVPLLTSVYLILSLGADEDAQGLTTDGDTYLQAAASLLGHVIQVPYLPAVQALLLLATAYRGRNKDGLAWQMVGMSIRIGHTIGLHKHSAVRPSQEHGVTQRGDQLFHSRIWAVCCCLEKILQLETGRPSAIANVDRDQMMGQLQRAPGHDFLQWNMGLAEYQSDISHHIYSHKPGDRTAKGILQDTARLDQSLQSWKSNIPTEFQPGNELFRSNEDLHIAAFLSIQWYQAMIAVHRAALIAPGGSFDAEVEQYCAEDPSKFRLLHGELICANSARSIIRLSLDLHERKSESRILTANPTLLASAALGIYLMKHPGGRAQAADLELLKAAVELTADHYTKSGQDRRMAQGITSIHAKVRLYFRQNASIQRRVQQEAASTRPQHETPRPKSGRHTDAQTSTDSSRNWPNTNSTSPANSLIPPYQNLTGTASMSQSQNHQHESVNAGETSAHDRAINIPLPSGHGWTPLSQEYDFLQGRNDNFSDSLLISQDMPLNMDRLPFEQYNVEELYNWMFQVDSVDDTQAFFAPSHM